MPRGCRRRQRAAGAPAAARTQCTQAGGARAVLTATLVNSPHPGKFVLPMPSPSMQRTGLSSAAMAETATEAPPMPPPPPLYTNTAGEAKLKQHYDATLASLPFPHEERWVDTSFGRAHVVVCGAPDAPPLVLWHGTAAPAPFMLLAVQPLLQHYRVFCPDIPCQGNSVLKMLQTPSTALA